jgi:hypothetical protein
MGLFTRRGKVEQTQKDPLCEAILESLDKKPNEWSISAGTELIHHSTNVLLIVNSLPPYTNVTVTMRPSNHVVRGPYASLLAKKISDVIEAKRYEDAKRQFMGGAACSVSTPKN